MSSSRRSKKTSNDSGSVNSKRTKKRATTRIKRRAKRKNNHAFPSFINREIKTGDIADPNHKWLSATGITYVDDEYYLLIRPKDDPTEYKLIKETDLNACEYLRLYVPS